VRLFSLCQKIRHVKCGAQACLAASARSSTIRGRIKITHSIKCALAEKWRAAGKIFSQRIIPAVRFCTGCNMNILHMLQRPSRGWTHLTIRFRMADVRVSCLNIILVPFFIPYNEMFIVQTGNFDTAVCFRVPW